MFNAGSSAIFGPNGENLFEDASVALMNSILAPSSAALFTIFSKQHISREFLDVRLDYYAFTNGILAGLVSITAGCNCVDSWSAVLIGVLGSLTYSYSCKLAQYLEIDDPLAAV